MSILIDFLIFALVYMFGLPFRILPYRASLKFGILIARMLYPIATKHRRIADENLKHAFPGKDEEWRKKLIHRHFNHLGIILADSFYGGRRDDAFLKKYIVFEEGSKEIERRAIDEGTGLILITGHLGLWELLVWYTGFVLHGGGIYKKIRNRFMDTWYKKVREKSGIKLFTIDESSATIRYIKKGGPVGFVADQNAGPQGIFVDFLNRPASTFKGPALIANMANAKMLFYTAVLHDDGKIHISIQDLGRIDRKKFKTRDEAIKHYTGLWVKTLEKRILKHPEQYFWVHRRWKTRPVEVETILTKQRQFRSR